jgi:hypothetical protein
MKVRGDTHFSEGWTLNPMVLFEFITYDDIVRLEGGSVLIALQVQRKQREGVPQTDRQTYKMVILHL